MSCATVTKQLPLLRLLATTAPSTRKTILKAADYNLIKAIVECVYNVLVGNVKLSTQCTKKLRKHKKVLRKIHSKRSKKWKNKKKVIVQSGGSFLPLLLAPVISYLADKIIGS